MTLSRYYRSLVGVLGVLSFVTILSAQPQLSHNLKDSTTANSANPDYRAVLNKYCVTCHNEKAQMGGLMLDKADLTKIPEQADVWEKVDRKLRSGMMPPVGMPHPDPAVASGLAGCWKRNWTTRLPRIRIPDRRFSAD